MAVCLWLDIYIASVSASHHVCHKDYYLAIVSTIVETDTPERELQPGYDLLGEIVDRYCQLVFMCCVQRT